MAGLYLHIPFCEHKCVYCDFYSIESLDPIDAFVAALRTEIGMYAYRNEEPFGTIFFGGGTPTMLSETHLERLLRGLRERVDVSEVVEFTRDSTVEVRRDAYSKAPMSAVVVRANPR